MSHEFTDRYEALGIPYPDPETMCKGQCEGVGAYPVKQEYLIDEIGDFYTLNPTPEQRLAALEYGLWISAHFAEDAHADGPCDGYHFIKCPDCNGTGKAA
jgi:hypothetical protein